MPDPIRCCLLGICCQPKSQEQKDALASYLQTAIDEFSGNAQQKLAHVADKLITDFVFKARL